MSKVAELHKHMSPKSLGISIVTCSTSKFAQQKAGEKPDDKSGDIIESFVLQVGHRVAGTTTHLRLETNDSETGEENHILSDNRRTHHYGWNRTIAKRRDYRERLTFPSEGDSWIRRTLQED